jgi:hypothetical protein
MQPKKMARRWSALTPADVQMLADKTPPSKYSVGGFTDGDYMPEFVTDLVGREFELVFDDGLAFNYRFTDLHETVWSVVGYESHIDYCDVVRGGDNVYFINHYCGGSVPPESHQIVVDLDNGLVTACVAKLCNPDNAREVYHDFHFGLVRGYRDPGYRHDYTEDMVGKAIYWVYNIGGFDVKHIYTCPTHYTVCGMLSGDAYWTASNPADYIKIRDGLYIFSFLEERQSGSQGFFLMDLYKLHDVGCFFGVNLEGIECYTVGAKGTWSTMYTLPGNREKDFFDWER